MVVRRTMRNWLSALRAFDPALDMFLVVCLAVALPLGAQNVPAAAKSRIEGTVLDASGAAVPGARVELRCGSFSANAVTGRDGAFSFAVPPAAACTVSAKATGFQGARHFIAAPRRQAVRITLVLVPVALAQQIVVTATRTPTPLSQAPLGESRITSKQLETTGALSLDGALRHVTGFSLFRRSDSRNANPPPPVV